MTFQDPAGVFFRPIDSEPKSTAGGSALFWRTKRGIDVAVSLCLLPVLLCTAAVLALLNPVLNPGPLIFRQTRMGHHCRPFSALKFRTMRGGKKVTRGPEDPLEVDRVTPLGIILRQTRIDELPQIINVLRGEMSLIGPRPDVFDHAQAYLRHIPHYRARHAVRPGISGLAQVTLGYAAGLEATRAKAAMDLAYLRHAGPRLEALIFWRTLVTVALRKGV